MAEVMKTPFSFSGFVFHQDGFALALDPNEKPLRVEAKTGNSINSLPLGFSTCRIEVDISGAVAEFISPYEDILGAKRIKRIDLLKTKWDEAYLLFKWNQAAGQQPFLSLDIESDGLEIWEAGLVDSNNLNAKRFTPNDGANWLGDLEREINKLLPDYNLVGHNIRKWDIEVLKRSKVSIPSEIEIWDTLEQEQILCKNRPRPSYALQTVHRAEVDAFNALRLAQNQWIRINAPPNIAETAWSEAHQFFVIPSPKWTHLVPGFNNVEHTWDDIEREYHNINSKSVNKAIQEANWRTVILSDSKKDNGPFNPASPKRIDYWYRLFPALEAACGINNNAILFVQHKHEIEKLVEVVQKAFTGDVRRCVRQLERQGGILVLHDKEWGKTLAEGLPEHTTLILEKMPELTSDSKAPVLDLEELGKMTLWQRASDTCDFVCLDARLGNKIFQSPFALAKLPYKWRAIISRKRLEQAAFRQSTEEFSLNNNWESDISKLMRQPGTDSISLHSFQQSKLAKILPRDGIPFEYIERATGGGKSLIFQAAALYRGETTGRITVVVSPLRALIHDQVNKLHEIGFALDVEALSGDMNRTDIEDTYRRIAGGETKLVYTAPERFRSKIFLQALETRIHLDAGGQPEFWVFDEAHCISLWGLEFRPDYRKAAAYIRESRNKAGTNAAPVLLVSATLTRLAKDDIEKVLGIK
jgi:hypothetical protein